MILSLENGNDITIEQNYHTHSHFIRIYLKRIAFFCLKFKVKRNQSIQGKSLFQKQ